jgi:hypothetical protein
MSRLVRVILAVIISISLGGATAFAANGTPETAVVVSSATPSVGGTLFGQPGGSYAFYRLAYPGGNAAISVHLTWNPGWQSTGPAFGFNVYGPGGLVGQGIRGDDAGAASTSNLTFSDAIPGDYLVQVYDYTDGGQHGFSVDFTGLGAAPAPVTGNATPDKAVQVQSQSFNVSGSLVGNKNGAFSFFDLDYPGGNWPMTVSLSFSPADQLPSDAFGFNIYQAGEQVAKGYEISRSGSTATSTATITNLAPGPYTLQIANYADGVNASFAIGVTGLTGTIVGASGNGSGDQAIRLSSAQSAGRGTIAGSSAGAFAYFGFDYQGNNEKVGITLGVEPGYSSVANGVGFNVYRGSDLVASSMVTSGRTSGDAVAWVQLANDTAGYYVVQVLNYIPGVTVNYTLRTVGLR